MSGGLILDIIVCVIILLFVLISSKRGFANCIISVFSLIISLILAFVLYKPVASFLEAKTPIDDNIKSTMQVQLSLALETNNDVSESNLPDSIKNYMQSAIDSANRTKEDAIVDVSNKIATNTMYVISFVGVFIIARIILLLIKLISGVITNVPVIHQLDAIGGALCGLLEGLVIVYVALTVISIASPVINDNQISKYIDDSHITKEIYNNNIVIKNLFK